MSSDSNGEKKECPYCGDQFSSQGIHTHVMRSVGNGHGPHNEVPDGFNSHNLKAINKNQGMDVEHSQAETATNHLYLCNWCNQLCKGERGYKIHLGKSTGCLLHPDDASIEDEEYTLIPCDDEWNPFMDLDDVYQIQKRRRERGKILNSKINRPIHNVSDDVVEQIATLLSLNPQMKEKPKRVKNIFSCTDEDFQEAVELNDEQENFNVELD